MIASRAAPHQSMTPQLVLPNVKFQGFVVGALHVNPAKNRFKLSISLWYPYSWYGIESRVCFLSWVQLLLWPQADFIPIYCALGSAPGQLSGCSTRVPAQVAWHSDVPIRSLSRVPRTGQAAVVLPCYASPDCDGRGRWVEMIATPL